ncbi:MAG: molybdopterin-dependent oxidoreductase [Chloroflexota bacterium]|nr:molybdopterin-dependent oxidoreductase [Chloroflexota bacterium]
MMNTKLSGWTNLLIAILITVPLLVIISLGHTFMGLPSLPADVFNPVRDALPGDLIVFGIQRMVDVIIGLNLGRVDEAGKIAETAMAAIMVLVLLIIAGVILLTVFQRSQRQQVQRLGLIGGAVVGAIMAAISLLYGVSATIDPRIIGGIWLLLLFVGWGLAHAWVYERVTRTADAAAVSESAASANALNRRQFLVTVGAASATVTVVGAGLSALLNTRISTPTEEPVAAAGAGDVLPNADDPVVPAPGTRPEVTPVEDHYRIDIAIVPPVINEANWTLPFTTQIGGEARTLAQFTLDEIKAYESVEAYVTMSCISNRVAGDLISTTKWTGVQMQRLLQDVPLPEGATHLKMTCADGFDETVSLDIVNNDERVMLAYFWEDKPLTTEHGFPIRIHIPDLYGMKQPKWITGIEVLGEDEDGYWVRRGWDKEARVRATSVIDTIATDMMVMDDEQSLIPVGGIAWAGARGVAAVEVRIDGGDWQPARVRAPISDRTWVIWRYDWAFTEGEHTFEVRCIEANGAAQIEAEAGVRPSGATGIHEMRAMI